MATNIVAEALSGTLVVATTLARHSALPQSVVTGKLPVECRMAKRRILTVSRRSEAAEALVIVRKPYSSQAAARIDTPGLSERTSAPRFRIFGGVCYRLVQGSMESSRRMLSNGVKNAL